MIINLTQHKATPEQLAAGVFEPTEEERAEITKLLTFEEMPDQHEINERAYELAQIAVTAISRRRSQMTDEQRNLYDQFGHGSCAMIGGAPYLLSALERELTVVSVYPLYAFSTRESEEETLPDGSVRKVNVFRFGGFVGVL